MEVSDPHDVRVAGTRCGHIRSPKGWRPDVTRHEIGHADRAA
jgi:hypothetical protein